MYIMTVDARVYQTFTFSMMIAWTLLVVLPVLVSGCGRRPAGSRVINGDDAAPHSWPWQVSLQKNGFHSCGGTLIRPDWVLTAAHCVFKNPNKAVYRVVVGAHNRHRPSSIQKSHRVKMLIVHHNYSPRTLNNDIALIQLYKPVALSDQVNVACLPTKHATVGAKCYLTGWGVTEKNQAAKILQQTALPVVSQRQCRLKYNVQEPYHLCAGEGRQGASGGCNGDSGGPLVCEEEGRWVLHGAVSFGKRNCPTTAYTVFSRVFTYMSWINRNIDQGPSPPTGRPTPPQPTPPESPPPPQPTTAAPGGCTDRWGSRCRFYKGSCSLAHIKAVCRKTCQAC